MRFDVSPAIIAALLCMPATGFSASPATGSLSDSNPSLTYASTFTQANATFDPPTCTSAANRFCDDYALTVNLPAGYVASHPAGQIIITTSWLTSGDDFDIYLLSSTGAYLKTQANTGASPEIIELPLSQISGGGGTAVQFTIRIVLYAKGTGTESGKATTSVVLDPGTSDPCVLPGVRVVLDPSRDQDPSLGAANQDIQFVSFAELASDTNTVTFNMKVRSLSGALPANGTWVVYFTGANNTIYWVRLETNASSAASYSYGTRSGTTDTRVGAADAGSYQSDGNIQIKLQASKFGSPAVGQKVTAVFGRTYVLVGALLVRVDDETDTGEGAQTGSKQYTLVGNTFCGVPPPETPCVLPGITLLTDPAGDFGAPGGAQQDIRSVSAAELGEDLNALSLTMKVSGLSGSLTASATWTIYFTAPNNVQYWVNMKTDSASAVTFNFGTRTDTTDTTVGVADAGSFKTDGTITIKIAADKIGSPVADQKLTGVFGRTYVRGGGPAGPGVLLTTDSAPDTIPGTAQYTRYGNAYCGTPPPESPCVLPGITVATDPAGDQSSPGTSNVDIRSVSLAELGTDTNMVTFTMKVSSLSGTLPANSSWVTYFTAPNNNGYFVRMESNASSVASYSYGTFSGNLDTRIGAADSGSYTPTGLIHIKLANSKFGNSASAQTLTKVFGRTYQQAGVLLLGVDSAPDTTPGTGQYTLVGNAACGNSAPIPHLAGLPTSGPAPLPVDFDAGLSTDPDSDAIVSYTFDFKDGSAAVTQSMPTIRYTYTQGGTFQPSVTVTDARGKASADPATVEITVTGSPIANPGSDRSEPEGTLVSLDGSASTNGNSGPLSFVWKQQGTPTVTINNSTGAVANFTAPTVCERTPLTFNLQVSNAGGVHNKDVTITIANINQRPQADAGQSRTVGSGQDVVLSAANSFDPDTCQTLTYEWRQFAGPRVYFLDPTSKTQEFVAPNVSGEATLQFRLYVRDSDGEEDTATVTIRVGTAPVGLTKILGGGLPASALLILGLLAGIRRATTQQRQEF